MTGAELAAALRLWANTLERAGRVNGLNVEVLPGAHLTVVASATERSRAFRKRSQTVPDAFPERSESVADPPSLSGSDLSLSGSGDSRLPDCLPENLSGRARVEPKRPGSKPPKPKPGRWRRVPQDWNPNDEHREIARSLGVAFEHELANFRDHEFKDLRSDADASFRKWLRRAPEMRLSAPPRNGKPPGAVEHEARQGPERRVYRPESDPKPIDLQATLAGVAQARKAMRT